MEAIRSSIKALDDFIGSSTFGRIFRLEGSGHVSTPRSTVKRILRPSSGLGDQEYPVHH
jgi:hypothetical protein